VARFPDFSIAAHKQHPSGEGRVFRFSELCLCRRPGFCCGRTPLSPAEVLLRHCHFLFARFAGVIFGICGLSLRGAAVSNKEISPPPNNPAEKS
jgi:hypothetical protein